MHRNLTLLLLFSLLWIAITHERELRPAIGNPSLPQAANDRGQYCSRQTCGARAKAGSCRPQLSRRIYNAPNPSSHPAGGDWYSPSNYDNSVDEFMRGMVARQFISPNGIVRIDKEDVSSQLLRFTNEPTSLAMLGLFGCIGLIVMSNQAVWMAHVYEAEILRASDKVFKKQGIDVLLNGGRNGDMLYGLSGLRKNVFARGQDPVAVILAPKQASSGFQYEAQMQKIDQMVKKTIGVTPKWVGYVPNRYGSEESRFDLTCTTTRGKVLVQYQPSNPGSGRSNAEARIWIEGDNWTYAKSWSPQSNQVHH
ncbi:hypothetical protein LX36DRAFT_728407 [Colletotrichum falcatum]|nr:hypothetical protein LX36DRAFT_728407 [Colletotrichum falcatum]